MEYIQSLLEQDKQRREELYRQQQEYGRLMTEYMDAKREIARLKGAGDGTRKPDV